MLREIQDLLISKLVSSVDAGLLFCKNDPHSTILYANDYFFTMIGYTREEVQQLFRNRFAEMVVDDVPEILEKIAVTINQGKNLDYEFRMRKKDGSIIWIHDTAAYDKKRDAFYVVLMDITEKKTIQYQMQKLLSILEHIPNKIIIADLDKKVEYINAELSKYPHMDEKEMGSKDLSEIMCQYIIGHSFNELWERVICGMIVSFETRYKNNNQIIAHDKNYLVPVMDNNSKIISVMQVSEDLMKQNDALTGLPNRGMFENYFEEQRRLTNEMFYMTLFVIDIDDFKTINDVYGHTAGDLAIQKTACHLIELIEEEDYVSRYGGDEFVLLLKTKDTSRVQYCINKLMEFTKEPIEINGESFFITYSFGVASTNGIHLEYPTLFEYADLALYEAKHNGKQGYVIYEGYMANQQLFKQQYSKQMKQYIEKIPSMIRFKKYNNLNNENSEIMEAVYDIRGLSDNLREFLIQNEEYYDKYLNAEVFEVAFINILNKFEPIVKENPERSVCISLPAGFLLKPDSLGFLNRAIEKFAGTVYNIILKIIDPSTFFELKTVYHNFLKLRKLGYRIILGDFGREMDSFQFLLDFPTEFISVSAEFFNICKTDKKYNAVLKMILELAKLNQSKVILSGKGAMELIKEDNPFDYVNESGKVIV